MDFSSKHQYTIGVVARRTQTHPETLRVWERRYQLIVPGRSETGRRLYSESDIAKLLLVKQLTEQGHAVSSLADLSIDELRERVSASSPQGANSEARQPARSRVIFLNDALRLRIGRELLMFGDIEVLERPQAGQSLTAAPDADILIVELPTINERSLTQIQQHQQDVGCKAAVVVFNFAPKHLIDQIERAGIICIKGSATAAAVHRACVAAHRPLPAQAPQKTDTLAPRRFNADQLARLATLTSTIACECPSHLAELIINLGAFEQYSNECANRNDKDAQLHWHLHRAAGEARTILEESLVRLIDIEGIIL